MCVRVVTWCDVTCRVVRAAPCCTVLVPTWRTDEEAVVLACKTISCFVIIYYFSSQMKLIRLLKTNYGDHNFIHITNKVAYRACRARRDKLVVLVVTWHNYMWNLGLYDIVLSTHQQLQDWLNLTAFYCRPNTVVLKTDTCFLPWTIIRQRSARKIDYWF